MPVKIRLMRIGAKKRPFYRVVAVDEQRKRTGGYLELLGTYNPLTTPKEIILKQDRIDDWMKKGAQPSDGFLRIIGKAPHKNIRPPKKQKNAPPAPTSEPTSQKEEASSETKTQEVETKTEAPTQTTSETIEAEPQITPEAQQSTSIENTPEPEESSKQSDKE